MSGTGFNDPTANIVFDAASPLILKGGASALSKFVPKLARNLLREMVTSSVLNRNIRNWDGTVGMDYFNSPNKVLPYKRIDLTPKTSISIDEVNTPLDDPKTKFIYSEPSPYKLLDRWGIKHDGDFGRVGDVKFSDFGLQNWGIDVYGRYRLFDPMIQDFSIVK